ncbi:MAG: reverse transcriptase family protein, partial [Candidatus Thiodiazotropha sp.]
MKFSESTVRAPEKICQQWGQYYSTYYSDHEENHHFENYHYLNVKARVERYTAGWECTFYYLELLDAIKQLHKGKAYGEDRINNEHLIHSGHQFLLVIQTLVNLMLKWAYIPAQMKIGIIITIYKGGNRRKDDPNNYRAVTLTSSLLKLYERVLLNRLEKSLPRLNPLQGGFQKNMGCSMTSYLLQESVNYAKENNSKLYVCFLDVKQAFDNVWHDGLFLKLYDLGIDLYIWKFLVNLHENVTSYVKFRGYKSDSFNVLRGTRQGGVTSPLMYVCFKDELLNLLSISTYGFSIHGINLSCPTVADDMMLISLTRYGLQELMNICYRYSQLWRYSYNALKCAVLVFNESKPAFRRSNRQWTLGPNQVLERTSYIHLGIECNKEMKISGSTTDCCSKIRKTFFSILNSGLSEFDLHPLTLKKIYETVVLPKALYGCEFWQNIANSDLLKVERSHRLCIKTMQSIWRNTRTCVALSLIGSRSIELEIKKKKCSLFGQFCRLDPYFTAKRLFLHRLTSHYYFYDLKYGFVMDAILALIDLGLEHIVSEYRNSGMFPSKFAWKKVVNAKIAQERDNTFLSEVYEENLDPFLRLHSEVKPNYFWRLSQKYPHLLPACKSVVKLISLLFCSNAVSVCLACAAEVVCYVHHCIVWCPNNAMVRQNMWAMLCQTFGTELSAKLANMSVTEFVNVLLGDHEPLSGALDDERIDDFYCMVAGFLHRLSMKFTW